EVALAQLDADRGALELPVRGAATEAAVDAVVELDADAAGQQLLHGRAGGLGDGVALGQLHHDDLRRGGARGDAHAVVVAVDHDRGPDQAGRDAPRRLPRVLHLAALVLEADVERLGEVLRELVAGAHLQRLAVAHHPLARPRADRAGEGLP